MYTPRPLRLDPATVYMVIHVQVSAFDMMRLRSSPEGLLTHLATWGLRLEHQEKGGTIEWWDDAVGAWHHYRQVIPRQEVHHCAAAPPFSMRPQALCHHGMSGEAE